MGCGDIRCASKHRLELILKHGGSTEPHAYDRVIIIIVRTSASTAQSQHSLVFRENLVDLINV